MSKGYTVRVGMKLYLTDTNENLIMIRNIEDIEPVKDMRGRIQGVRIYVDR